MILKFFKRCASTLTTRFLHISKSPKTKAMTIGTLCGIVYLAMFFQLFASLGMSLGVVTGCLLCVAVILDQGVRRFLVFEQKSVSPNKNVLAVSLLIGFVALSPYLMEVVRYGIGFFSLESLASPLTMVVLGCVSAMLFLAVPLLLTLACAQSLLTSISKTPSQFLAMTRFFFMGIGTGLLCAAYATTPLLGAYIAAILSGSILLAVAFHQWFIAEKVGEAQTHDPELEPTMVFEQHSGGLSWLNFWPALFVGICGAAMAVICRELQQTISTSLYIISAQWAALLLAFAWGVKRRWSYARRDKDEFGQILSSGLLPAVWLAFCLLAFPLLVELVLYLNANQSSATLHVFLRGAIAGAFVVPLGFTVGICSLATVKTDLSNTNKKKTPTARWSYQIVFRSMHFVVGMLVVRWAGLNVFTLAQLMIIIAMIALIATVLFCLKERYVPRTKMKGGLVFAGLLIVSAGLFWQQSDNFAFSSRLLFSSEFFVARQRGVERDQIPFLDEARQLATVEGESGTYSLWRYRGFQIHLRESGIPQGVVSTEPGICPQYSSEILPTVMPLVMHESPRRVMVLGMGVSTPLFTAQSFPIESLTCVESDEMLINLNRETIWKESRRDLLADSRVKILAVDPNLALQAKSHSFDVIVSNPIHSSLMRSAPYFTSEFYRSAASSLSKDGIFSQRFFQVDYGSFPLKSVVKSMQVSFSDVMALETGVGEMVLLGTNSSRGFVRKGLVERLQAPHVRVVLSEIGWDWTIPLNLTAFDNDRLQQIVQEGSVRENTTANGWFASCLPKEILRWAPKWKERQKNLKSSTTRLLSSDRIDGNDPALIRRISEVVGQKKLMVSYPDQFWAYRQTVKKQIVSKPSELIRQVSTNSKLTGFSENDKRRMSYFSDLEKAAKETTLGIIGKIENHEFPYDPLISYFLHQEVAELYAKSEAKSSPQELQHRLHAIYFGQAQDRSVRNVADAIGLLVEQNNVCESPLQRWDHLNALVQVMKNRWEVRGLIRPKSAKIVLNDLKYSIIALESAKRTMGELQSQIPVEDEHWDQRKIVIERQMIRPLRTYRKKLLEYHMNKQARTKKLLDKINQ